MVKKLHTKLILICLLSVGIVLSTIIVSSYISSIVNITIKADGLLDVLEKNSGKIPFEQLNEIDRDIIYFSVMYKDNELLPIISPKETAISNDQIIELSQNVLNRKIFLRGYVSGFRYVKIKAGDVTNLIFVDCTHQFAVLHFTVSSVILVSLLCLLTIFSLLVLFGNRILKPIIESHEKQKKFITNASHELKTPLTVITANNELLEMEYGENEYTQTINKQVNKLATMTNALVMLAKIDEMNILNDKEEFSISDAAFDTIHEFKNVIGKEFIYHIDEGISYLGNEKLIRDLIRILLDNSRKYSTSFVEFTLTKHKNKINITCINDAEGLTTGNLDHFADRFYRSDESRVAVFSGSGIGLSLAKDIIEMHKGSMKIYSPDGKIIVVNITF